MIPRASAIVRNHDSFRHSSRNRPWKLSDVRVLDRLTGRDEVEPHVVGVRPLGERSAYELRSLGGHGVPFVVDHLDVGQVMRFADQIRDRYGHIDILVNDMWGAERLKGGPPDWNKPIWQVDLQKGLRILRLAIDTHLVTSHYLLPILTSRPGGLLVEVTDGTADYNASHYRISVSYDLAKVAIDRRGAGQGRGARGVPRGCGVARPTRSARAEAAS